MENSEIINKKLKGRVMRRIYVIYVRNFIFENSFLVAALFILVVLFFSISISDVFRNTPKESLSSFSNYMFSAFNNTELATKGLVSLLALCAIAPLANSVLIFLRQSQGLRHPS